MNLSLEPRQPSERKSTASELKDPIMASVRLTDLCFTDRVDLNFLRAHGPRLPGSPPIVAHAPCCYVILDGNHRCAYNFVFGKFTGKCSSIRHRQVYRRIQ